jgi:phosphonate transport system ATP-binding protein
LSIHARCGASLTTLRLQKIHVTATNRLRGKDTWRAQQKGDAMFALQNLTKRFGGNLACDRVSFSVDAPKMIGIIGRSGAGKSTLLRMLNRLTDATSGQVIHQGRDILTLKGAEKRAWQSDCAMIFQQFNLVPRMDVVSNVLHGTLNRRGTLATMFNLYPSADIEQAIAILDRLGIAAHAAKRAEALSGGQQQRVAIARALMQDPQIILADEPIASLDPMNAQVVMEALRRIHEEDGRMVIANLHTLDTARRYCDRVIGMRDGRVVFDGTPAQLTTGVARDIYGADARFSEEATSTSIEALERSEAAARLIRAAETTH